jgi:hypothetical protein
MSWWEAHSIRSKLSAVWLTIRTFHMVPNPECYYTVTFVTSLKYNHTKNTITERVSSHIRGPRRCCALSGRTFSKMLALTSTTHHAVMLSTKHHRPQHCIALHYRVSTHPTQAKWHLRSPLLNTGKLVGCSRTDSLLPPKWPRKPAAVSARSKGCGKRCAATTIPRLPRLGWVGVGP